MVSPALEVLLLTSSTHIFPRGSGDIFFSLKKKEKRSSSKTLSKFLSLQVTPHYTGVHRCSDKCTDLEERSVATDLLQIGSGLGVVQSLGGYGGNWRIHGVVWKVCGQLNRF